MKSIDIKEFALSFFKYRNAEEAAIHAGVNPLRAKTDGIKLRFDRRVRRQLQALQKVAAAEECDVRSGLERLAYGRINDAAALAFCEEVTPHMLAQADLFNVSEIKRVKGGGVEIKFFDRQKALEKLDELNAQQKADSKAKNLVEAIYGSQPQQVESDSPLEGEQ